MRSARVVQLRWTDPSSALADAAERPETLTYPGLVLLHHCDDLVVVDDSIWLPVGNEEPTFTGDEKLITAPRGAGATAPPDLGNSGRPSSG